MIILIGNCQILIELSFNKFYYEIVYMYLFIITVIVFITFTTILLFNIVNRSESFSNDKTFSNTQTWGDDENKILSNLTPLGKDLIKTIPDVPFPTNSSFQTKREISDIKKKMKSLTYKKQKDIIHELYLYNIINRFGTTYMENRKITNLLIKEINPIIMNMKQKYNRVRPFHLDNNIKPTIEPPEHPSYPSGHAIQSYFINYLLSEKYPHKKDIFNKIAHNISINREYAGVHYQSDTSYGKLVAKKLSEYFSKNNNPLL